MMSQYSVQIRSDPGQLTSSHAVIAERPIRAPSCTTRCVCNWPYDWRLKGPRAEMMEESCVSDW